MKDQRAGVIRISVIRATLPLKYQVAPFLWGWPEVLGLPDGAKTILSPRPA